MSLKLFITLALVGTAAAMCPSGCSGHGKCESSPKDSCTCRCTAKHYMDPRSYSDRGKKVCSTKGLQHKRSAAALVAQLVSWCVC